MSSIQGVRILFNSFSNTVKVKSHQVVIRPDAEQFSEVAKGHRSVGFKAEVWEVVSWSEVAAFTEIQHKTRRHQLHSCFK